MYLDAERSTYQKVILCILAAMAVIFAVWTGISRNNEGVLFRETLLEVSEQGSTTVYSGVLYSTPFTITSWEDNGTKLVNFSADGEYSASCRVEFPEGTIKTQFGTEVNRIRIVRNDEVLFSGGYDPAPESNSHIKYYNEDGTFTMSPSVSVYASTGNPWTNFVFDVSDIMRFAGTPETSARGSWGIYFIALIVSVIGALITAFPETAFYLSHFRYVRDPEPTEFYYTMHKLGCALDAVGVLVLYIIGLNTLIP